MIGIVKINGEPVKVTIEDNMIVLTFPEGAKTDNWQHSIMIKRGDDRNDG